MGAIRAEWRKLLLARSVQVLAVGLILITLALCWQGTLNSASGVNDPRLATVSGSGALALAVYSLLLAPILGAMLGARIGAHDFAAGTVGTAIATMGRSRYAWSKLASLLMAAVLTSAAVGATGAVFGAVVQRDQPGVGTARALVEPLAVAAMCTLLSGLLAFVLASILRSVKGAVVVLIGLFLSPSALPTELGMPLARLQPYYLAIQILPSAFADLGTSSLVSLNTVNELGVALAAALALALTAAYVAAAVAIWRHREVRA